MGEEALARSRPRLEARRRAFLEAASAVFLEKGYASATLDDIMARSGGSRQTLYVLFGGKQGLFEALVADLGVQIFRTFHDQEMLDRTPDEVLADVGSRYVMTVTAPAALGVYRLVVAEAFSRKEVGEQFWASGPAHTRTVLAHYLAGQASRGTLQVPDPEEAAQQFLGMLLGQFQLPCLLGLRETPGVEEVDTFVRTAVALFLDGCRARV